MDFNIGAAIIAGVVATVVMTIVMYMGRAMMPQQMPMNILHMLGTMMTRSTGPAYVMGTMMHGVMGIVFALIHVAVFVAFGLEALLAWGILFGVVHWVIAGMGMGMMGTMHPVIRSGEMPAPGPFVKNLPMMNVMGFLMVHVIYGLVVGGLYQALA
ncbi:MAG: hypothetical protein IIC83_13265 [Chloroflexi bacterium]|nr:hypothetical protein [Chloroflexota bacterium]MCH7653358.1 hypothetical protein [Chloroflexota bacterium]